MPNKFKVIVILMVPNVCFASGIEIIDANDLVSLADELLRVLRSDPQGKTRTEIRDWFGRNRKAQEIGGALAGLQSLGLAHCVIEPTKGHSVERWFAV